ncbi:MAG: hypothetical protein FRX49_08591 [Trebouxia sp. A1-2]|nr:MAG: hypothetical protein FRX49_08591 [Trebouxia sp. A1-2]
MAFLTGSIIVIIIITTLFSTTFFTVILSMFLSIFSIFFLTYQAQHKILGAIAGRVSFSQALHKLGSLPLSFHQVGGHHSPNLQRLMYLTGLHAHALSDVGGHSLDYALAHLNGSLGGLIPPKLLLSVMRNLGDLDNLFQKDGELLQHKFQSNELHGNNQCVWNSGQSLGLFHTQLRPEIDFHGLMHDVVGACELVAAQKVPGGYSQGKKYAEPDQTSQNKWGCVPVFAEYPLRQSNAYIQ